MPTRKEIKKKIHDIERTMKASRDAVREHQRTISKKGIELGKLKRQLNSSAGSAVDISDHALVRYLERISDTDVDALKSTIITPELIKAAQAMAGNCEYNNGRFVVVIRDFVIVTIKN